MPPNLRKGVEPDDPHVLVAKPVPGGDLESMAECLVEEFALLGWTKVGILSLFSNPWYQAPHLYLKKHGRRRVEELVERVLNRCGPLRVSVVEAPEDPNEEEIDHAQGL